MAIIIDNFEVRTDLEGLNLSFTDPNEVINAEVNIYVGSYKEANKVNIPITGAVPLQTSITMLIDKTVFGFTPEQPLNGVFILEIKNNISEVANDVVGSIVNEKACLLHNIYQLSKGLPGCLFNNQSPMTTEILFILMQGLELAIEQRNYTLASKLYSQIHMACDTCEGCEDFLA